MLNFNFNLPTNIFFGDGSLENLKDLCSEFGKRVLIVYGSSRIKKSGLLGEVYNILESNGKEVYEVNGVKPNPRVDLVRDAIYWSRDKGIDFILAIGGGSVVDSAKAIAAGYYYSGDVWDFYDGKAQIEQALPLGVILTLAATGSEMNGNSVLTNMETGDKNGTGSPYIKPKFSILDPKNTFTVPKYQTACGVADIMSHVFEQYFSPTKDTFIQDRLAEAILKTCVKFGPIAIENGEDYNARANILWAGTLALNGLLDSGKMGDWAVHPIEHELSAKYDIAHGAGLAILTPNWMEYVIDDENLYKFYNLAVNLWGVAESSDRKAVAYEGISQLRDFFKSLGLSLSLSELNIGDEKLEIMAKNCSKNGPVGNFKKLDYSDILEIYKRSL